MLLFLVLINPVTPRKKVNWQEMDSSFQRMPLLFEVSEYCQPSNNNNRLVK